MARSRILASVFFVSLSAGIVMACVDGDTPEGAGVVECRDAPATGTGTHSVTVARSAPARRRPGRCLPFVRRRTSLATRLASAPTRRA
jgi:hypothetical protein